MGMTWVTVNVKLPKETNEFYRKEGKSRLIGKSAVIRKVLMDHVEKEKQKSRGELVEV